MSARSPSPTDYVDFKDHSDCLQPDERLAKHLTFIGAAAVSLLCYEHPDHLSNQLKHDSKYAFVSKSDIISAVYSLGGTLYMAQTNDQSTSKPRSPPVLAWSVRLQTLFIGFAGTNSNFDWVSNIDVRSSCVSTLATRFHAGFQKLGYQYSSLISKLARRYKVVVCGHSLGGAVALIAGYHAIVESPEPRDIPVNNVWESCSDFSTQQGLTCSVITFGSPSSMVVEAASTTTTPPMRFGKYFHHFINPDDPVPFIVNNAKSGLNDVGDWIVRSGSTWTKYGPPLEMLWSVLKSWMEANTIFGYYGCMYVLERGGDDHLTYRHVNSVQAFPLPLQFSFNSVKQHLSIHSMDHYNHCLGSSFAECQDLTDLDSHTVMTPDQFCDDCLPSTASSMDCNVKVVDDKIIVKPASDVDLLEFFFTKINSTLNNAGESVELCVFQESENGGTRLIFEVQIPSVLTREKSRLMQKINDYCRSLYLCDAFNRSTKIKIKTLEYATMKELNTVETFESIRLTMIIALVKQIAKVRELIAEPNADLCNARSLAPEARTIAEGIDIVVSNACPLLVLQNFDHAAKLVDRLWYPHAQFSQPPESEPNEREDIYAKVERECPLDMQHLLKSMLCSFSQSKVAETAVCKERDNPNMLKLGNVHKELISFAEKLQDFGEALVTRDHQAQDRIEQAIDQFESMKCVMRFCHTIIITQLDAPGQWYGLENWVEPNLVSLISGVLPFSFMAKSFPGLSSIGAGLGSLLSKGAGILAWGVVSLVIFGGAVGMTVWLTRTLRSGLFGRNYISMLAASLSALDIAQSDLAMPEALIASKINHTGLQHRNQYDTELLSKRCQQLSKGLKRLLKKQNHPEHEFKAFIFWAKWLSDVGFIAEMRARSTDKLYIGVEGPTGAGKSLLLETLTCASARIFNAGDSSKSRTTEIQSYEPPNQTSIFCDVPGTDDKDERMREVANLFRGLMRIIIFVIPCDALRSEAMETSLRKIVRFINERQEPHPFRILLNKIDTFEFHEEAPQEFEDTVQESKNAVIKDIKLYGKFSDDFTFQTRQSLGPGNIVAVNETLEDLVQPFSTYAQKCKNVPRTLSDHEPDVGAKSQLGHDEDFRNLYDLAERGVIWDTESLRKWLRNLDPCILPESRGRVSPDELKQMRARPKRTRSSA